MILRPRLIVQATTAIWVVFMGGALYASAIYSAYERREVLAAGRDREPANGVKQGLDGGGGSLPSLSGGQEPPSLPGNPVPLTSGKGGANPPAPGYAQCCLMPLGREATPSRAGSSGRWTRTSDSSAHGVRHVPGSGSPSSLGLTESRAGALSGGEQRTGAPGSYAGWASDSGRRGSIPHPLVHSIYEVTAYSHGCVLPRSGKEGPPQRAANGRWPIADVTVAADTRLHPFGTEVIVEGLGFRTVHDRGRAIVGRKLDLFVDSCREARRFGRRWLRVHLVPDKTTVMGSAQ